jgi:hypothetical protein
VPGNNFCNSAFVIVSFRISSGNERYFKVLSDFIVARSVSLSVTTSPQILLRFNNDFRFLIVSLLINYTTSRLGWDSINELNPSCVAMS